MDIKSRPNHSLYIETLRKMSPDLRLQKAFELSKLGKELFIEGLSKRFPNLDKKEIRKIYLRRIDKCHNRNY